MEDVKKFQKELLTNTYFTTKAVETFPPYMGYCFSSRYKFPSGLSLGIASDFFSTGGRNHIEDYSGYYKIDFLAYAFNLMIQARYDEKINKKISVGFEINPGLKLSTFKLKEEFDVSENKYSDQIITKSVSWLIKPLIRMDCEITPTLSMGIFAGYELNPESKLHLKDNPEAKLVHGDGSQVGINWSGIRAGFSLSVLL